MFSAIVARTALASAGAWCGRTTTHRIWHLARVRAARDLTSSAAPSHARVRVGTPPGTIGRWTWVRATSQPVLPVMSSSGETASWASCWPGSTTRRVGAVGSSSLVASPGSARAVWRTSCRDEPSSGGSGSCGAVAGKRAARPPTGLGCRHCAPTSASRHQRPSVGSSERAPPSSRRSSPRSARCWRTCRHGPRPIRRTPGSGSSTRPPPSSGRRGRRSRS